MSNSLLEQFIIESRDYLQKISEVLIDLEGKGVDKDLLNELFRIVHTLKGNSGLFDFPFMTKLLHASEDLMNLVREGEISYSSEVADILLEAMDVVSIMLDEIESSGSISHETNKLAEGKTKNIRNFISNITSQERGPKEEPKVAAAAAEYKERTDLVLTSFKFIPESFRMLAIKKALEGEKIVFVEYQPELECFYKGEDPFYLVRKTPGFIWGRCYLREEVSDPTLMDIYKCITNFELLSSASKEELSEHFKYVLEQVKIIEIEPTTLIIPEGEKNGGPVYEDFVAEARKYLEENNVEILRNAVKTLLELSSPKLYTASVLRWIKLLINYLPQTRNIIEALLQSLETENPPVFGVKKEIVTPLKGTIEKEELPEEFFRILNTQKTVLEKIRHLEESLTKANILKSVISSIENVLISLKNQGLLNEFKEICPKITQENFKLLEEWIDKVCGFSLAFSKSEEVVSTETISAFQEERIGKEITSTQIVSKVLKVDEAKVDRLMNLIGEFVVAKNSLFYLAQKVDKFYGIPELSKELKAQYGVLNRISEEMQDAIMQIRMVPVSTVFQRFPRFVRDLSKKLGKKVKLIIEGEETEADKNVIEALAEPLVHIIRNSLDHGIEPPEERIAKGKPETGTIILRAKHEADCVVIEIIDDGRGIDPNKVKLKAYQRGLITEEQLEKMKDEEAINLVFLPGFSTADTATDLSGRGVGMDVVRATVEKFGGSLSVRSILDKGTTVTLSLPLSMAVTHVMIVESANQRFGIPMDAIVETVRVSKEKIQTIKGKMTTVLRNRLVPIFYLNYLLEINKPHITNEDGEYAVLVLSVGDELMGVVIDKFHGTADIILKPFTGVLANIKIFSGTAIMGDGSVLLVINPKELIHANRIQKQ